MLILSNNLSVGSLIGQLDKNVSDIPSYDVFNLQHATWYNDIETNEWLKRKSLLVKEKY